MSKQQNKSMMTMNRESQKGILELKIIISEIKNFSRGLKNRFEVEEGKKRCELEDKSIEITQSKEQREKY